MHKRIAVVIPYTIINDGLLAWTQTRKEQGPLDGFEEFPGGKIGPYETPLAAAVREFEEELGVKPQEDSLTFFAMHDHSYDDRSVLLYIYSLKTDENDLAVKGLNAQKIGWETIENDVKQLNILEANKEFLPLFMNFTKKQLGLINE